MPPVKPEAGAKEMPTAMEAPSPVLRLHLDELSHPGVYRPFCFGDSVKGYKRQWQA